MALWREDSHSPKRPTEAWTVHEMIISGSMNQRGTSPGEPLSLDRKIFLQEDQAKEIPRDLHFPGNSSTKLSVMTWKLKLDSRSSLVKPGRVTAMFSGNTSLWSPSWRCTALIWQRWATLGINRFEMLRIWLNDGGWQKRCVDCCLCVLFFPS